MKAWVVRTALSDARSSVRTIAVSYFALVLGVAALLCVIGLRASFQQALANNTRELMGAEVEFTSKQPFSPQFLAAATPYLAASARELRFRTMASLANGDARLVQLHAVEGDYPFFGEIRTRPPEKWRATLQTNTPAAVVEEALLRQTGMQIGDSLTIGGRDFVVSGVVENAPGMMVPAYIVSPRVYVRLSTLADSPVLGRGALVDYQLYGTLRDGTTERDLEIGLKTIMANERIRLRLHEQRAEMIGKSFANVSLFLSLSAFVALLIGAAAAVAATHVYIQRKISLVAILCCVGARKNDALMVCFLEVTGLACAASIIGVGVGFGLQALCLELLSRYAPYELSLSFSPSVGIGALAVGVGSVVLYSLPLFSSLHKLTPLEVLRAQGAQYYSTTRDRFVSVSAIVLVVSLFAVIAAESLSMAAKTAAIALVGLAGLATLATILLWVVRILPERALSVAFRHGIKNLSRPGNATVPMICALGIVSLFSNTILISGHYLRHQANVVEASTTPNIFLYDIQADQEARVRELARASGSRILQETPVVMMRIHALKGRSTGEILMDPSSQIPPWSITREYWSSYREETVSNETLVAGTWTPRITPGTRPIPISLDSRIADNMGLSLGDSMVFDVQGQLYETKVGSLREIHWERMERNALVVFPAGVFEDVPQFRFMSLHVQDPKLMSELQRAISSEFPNISMVDLQLATNEVKKILVNIGWALLVITLVIGLGALLAMVGVSLASREVRIRELLLYRIMGARRALLTSVLLSESLVLGAVGIGTGLLLSLGAAFYFAVALFQAQFSLPVVHLVLLNFTLCGAVLATSALLHRGLKQASPLRLLQAE